MASILFKIVTPEKVVFEQEVAQVTLPIEGGEITVLPEHIPHIGALKPGTLSVRDMQGKEQDMAVSGGFAEFHDNTLTVLADTAERAEEIDVKRAEEARERAEQLKSEQIRMDSEEYARVAASLEKELARLRVAKKHHSKHMPHIES